MMTFTNSSTRSISALTNDDTKILGNIKPKLKKLQEQYNLQTNKYKTLNSSWTPLKDKTANRNVFNFSPSYTHRSLIYKDNLKSYNWYLVRP
jgi:hypothetical protein